MLYRQYGVYASRPWEPFDVIGEYVGRVVPPKVGGEYVAVFERDDKGYGKEEKMVVVVVIIVAVVVVVIILLVVVVVVVLGIIFVVLVLAVFTFYFIFLSSLYRWIAQYTGGSPI